MKAKIIKSIFGSKVFKPVYDDPPTTPPVTPSITPLVTPSVGKTFTQDEVNSIVAKERAADKKKNEQLVQQLESLKSSSQMTADEKKALEARIEELQTQYMTKEELAVREKKKLETELSTARDSAINEGKLWKTRFEQSLVKQAILDESAKDAYAPTQIVELLSGKSKVVESLVDGKPSGKFEVHVAFDDVDKDNKPIVLNLSVNDAVKRMKDLPDRFGNLFKSGVRSGLGGNNLQSTDGVVKLESILNNPAEYRKQRKTLREKGIL